VEAGNVKMKEICWETLPLVIDSVNCHKGSRRVEKIDPLNQRRKEQLNQGRRRT
jgi:hypothetical protein